LGEVETGRGGKRGRKGEVGLRSMESWLTWKWCCARSDQGQRCTPLDHHPHHRAPSVPPVPSDKTMSKSLTVQGYKSDSSEFPQRFVASDKD